MPTVAEKRATFRALHQDGFFILPNAWDAGSTARLERLGFRAIASTSAGAAWAAGKEDGQLGLNVVLDHLRLLVAATDLPINADFENGFADDPEGVALNVAAAAETGVAGVSVEDWAGHTMYDLPHAVERIAAARAALDPSVLLIGRNENFRVPGMSVAESVKRAVAYAEAGADCLFVPFLLDPGAVKELVQAIAPKPLNVLVGADYAKIAELAPLGVRRFSTGASLAGGIWKAFDTAANHLKTFDAP